jgi:4-aminobutyrate aminotransferase
MLPCRTTYRRAATAVTAARSLQRSLRNDAATAQPRYPAVKCAAPQVVVTRASGSCVFTAEGARFLDFTSGIGVCSTGHCHPTVAAAAAKQCATAVHVQQSCYSSAVGAELNAALAPLLDPLLRPATPRAAAAGAAAGDGAAAEAEEDAADVSIFFSNSGAEAVEGAMRLARQATGRDVIVAMQGGYHGRTLGTLSVTTSSNAFRGGRPGPLPGGALFAPFPFRSQLGRAFADAGGGAGSDNLEDEALSAHCLEQLELLTRQQCAAGEIAAVLVEPVLGEGGYIPAPRAFMRGLRAFCDAHGALLIADEVQTGFGRTGLMFASQRYAEDDGGGGGMAVQPDVLVMAKGIASGYPLSAVACRPELAARQAKGGMGGTYGGNAVACAAALATLRVFEEEQLLANALARGEQLREGMRAAAAAAGCGSGSGGAKLGAAGGVSDVRGLGLMIAVEFGAPGVRPGFAAAVSAACLQRGLMVLTTSVFEVLRFIPPLTVSEGECEEALALFGEALREVVDAQ